MKKVLVAMVVFLAFSNNCLAEEVVKYYKTILLDDGLSLTEEISEDEYEAVDDILLYSSNIETEYKRLKIINVNNKVTLNLDWKKTPYYQSYDVIALRGVGITFTPNTIYGSQKYNLNGSVNTISYTNTSTNTKVVSNSGFGISMNLVDNATSYNLTVSANYYKGGMTSEIFGTYQHSQVDITLAQSQKYTIGAGGYGNVLKFDNSVKSYFDNMSGVSISV